MGEIVVPRLGWTMDEGIFQGWLKREGEPVRAGEPLFTIEGDKAAQEIEAFESGTLRIAPGGPRVGDTVAVGAVLGHIVGAGGPAPLAAARPESASSSPAAVERRPTLPASQIVQADRRPATPRARAAARENGVDLTGIAGSGRDGRIRERDVLAVQPKSAPISNARSIIAQRMVRSQQSTAPVTLTTTADATNLVALRAKFKGYAPTRVPGITDLFLRIVAGALRDHPALNSRWDDGRIQAPSGIHIGVAVDTDAGLVVPVVRDVPSLSIDELAARTKVMIDKARSRSLRADEMQGGTFTITNLGAFGIDAFTPIINWPECAILGLGAIRKCPAVVGAEIVVRDLMTLSLTFDHRIVDGAPAARFLRAIVRAVESASID